MAENRVKVAVATGDGIHSNLHFGEAEEVSVYTFRDDGEILLEGKRTFPDRNSFPEPESGGCHAKNEAYLQEVIQLLRDCQYLLVEKIGSFPARVLLRNGIETLEQEGDLRKLLSILYDYINRKKKGTANNNNNT